MKNQARTVLFGLMCAVFAVWGIGAAGGASASTAPAVQQSVAVQAAVVNAAAATLHCRDHSSESKPVSGKVVVPTNYCYDPDTSNHRGWHDYCTSSPDSVYISSGAPFGIGSGTVNFRGPCARHDMCLQSTHSHSTCDGPLLSNLKKNCTQKFNAANPARYKCYAVAYTYYLVIKVKTAIS